MKNINRWYLIVTSIVIYKIFEQFTNINGAFVESIYLKNDSDILLYALLVLMSAISFILTVFILRAFLFKLNSKPIYFSYLIILYVILVLIQIPINNYLANLKSDNILAAANSFNAQILVWTALNYIIMIILGVVFFINSRKMNTPVGA